MICLQGPVFFNEDGDRQGLVEVGQMQGQKFLTNVIQ